MNPIPSQRSTSLAPRWSQRAAILIPLVALVPVLIVWTIRVAVHPRPTWAFYYDPEMIYFVEGSNLLHGRAPLNVDNPGTPVQILSATIEIFTGDEPESVESFRRIAYVLSALLLVACCGAFVWASRTRLSPLTQFASLCVLFLAPQLLEYRVVWSPESLLPAVGLAAITLLERLIEQRSLRTALALGVTVGIGIAVKLTFACWLPVLIIAALARRRNEGAGSGTLLAISSAGVLIGFATMVLPIASRLGAFAEFALRVSTHTGVYGSGPAGQPGLPYLAAQIWQIARTAKAWELIWLGSLLGIGVAAACGRARRGSLIIAACAAAGVVASHLIAGRGNATSRYLVSAAPLAALLLAECVELMPRRSWRWIGAVASFALLVKASAFDLHSHRVHIEAARRERRTIEAAVAHSRSPRSVVIYGWSTPEPSFALRAMSRDPAYLAKVDRLFPNEGDFTSWNGLRLPRGRVAWQVAVLRPTEAASFPEQLPKPSASIGEYLLFVRGAP